MFQGYQGMVDGGDNIVEAHWRSVSGIMQQVPQSDAYLYVSLYGDICLCLDYNSIKYLLVLSN